MRFIEILIIVVISLEMLMQEFSSLKAANDVGALKVAMQVMERVTSIYTKLTVSMSDGRSTLARQQVVIIPTGVHKFIAIAARDCKQYASFAQIIEAHLMDPLTGLARGEEPTGFNSFSEGNGA